MQHGPWRALRDLPHIDVQWTRDDHQLAGADSWWLPDQSTILMDARLPRQADRRCALAHELAHIYLGDDPTVDGLPDWQERRADLHAARWLIHIDALLDAFKWTGNLFEVADECWVTIDLLRVRLDHLHPSERHYLRRHLEEERV